MAYKMKGFSGFGNSPIKQRTENIRKPEGFGVLGILKEPSESGAVGVKEAQSSAEHKEHHPISSKIFSTIPEVSEGLGEGLGTLAKGVVGTYVHGFENIVGNIGRLLKVKSTKTGEVIGSKEHRRKKGYDKGKKKK